MPELPEVETIRLNLIAILKNQKLKGFSLNRSDIIKYADIQPSAFEGCILLDIKRHGKFLAFLFSGNLEILVHLRMTGKLIWLPALSSEEQESLLESRHTHAVLSFENGKLVFNDVRRFGGFELYQNSGGESAFSRKKLGPDAWTGALDGRYLFAQKKRHPGLYLKTFLLNQEIVAGLGNIYTDEIMFETGLRPDMRAGRLSLKDCERLAEATRAILEKAIEAGGTSFRDYRNAGNRRGQFQNFLRVYGRGGLACPVCGAVLEKITIGGRSSVFCPVCQKKK